MAMMVRAVAFEATDVAKLTRFWTDVLDGTDAGVALEFTASARPKTSKNRLHLDLASGPDQSATVSRLLDLGASRADIGQGDVAWDVLADPEGNEFCVLPHPELDFGLLQVCLDAADADVQGAFWTAALGWTVTARGTWGVCLRSPDGTGPSLVMGPPAAPKHGANRLLMNLATQKPDTVVADEIRLLLDAGASASPDDGTLRDPEGNEFRVAGLLP